MITTKLRNEKNAQTNQNYRAAYLYFGMSDYFSRLNLKSFSHWSKMQAKKKITCGLFVPV